MFVSELLLSDFALPFPLLPPFDPPDDDFVPEPAEALQLSEICFIDVALNVFIPDVPPAAELPEPLCQVPVNFTVCPTCGRYGDRQILDV